MASAAPRRLAAIAGGRAAPQLPARRYISSSARRAASAYTSTSTSTASAPAFADLAPPVPKPPSATWYTGSPSLASLRQHLDSLTHRTRHLLYSARVLTRYSSDPNFGGTGIRLRFLRWKALGVGTTDGQGDPTLRALLRQVSWKNREDFEAQVEGSAPGGGSSGGRKRLKISTYRELTRQLSELRQLQLYVHYALTLGGVDDTFALRKCETEIAQVVEQYGRLGRDVGERKGIVNERDPYGRYVGKGRKKEATARGWMVEVVHPRASSQEAAGGQDLVKAAGDDVAPPIGKVLINGKPLSEYFESPQQRAVVLQPFVITR